MQPVEHVVIAAAGLGSRLGLDIPKCLVDLGSSKLIDHTMALLAEVPDVRIVVGFKETEVIAHVRRIRPDVLFVRNPRYLSTTTNTSLVLGSRYLKTPFVIMDADLLIEPVGFQRFLRQCAEASRSILCYTEAGSENPVYVHLSPCKTMVTGFSRERTSPYEWCSVAWVNGIDLHEQTPFVYPIFEPHLPLPACSLDCLEVDTAQDLNRALRGFPAASSNSGAPPALGLSPHAEAGFRHENM